MISGVILSQEFILLDIQTAIVKEKSLNSAILTLPLNTFNETFDTVKKQLSDGKLMVLLEQVIF